MGISQVSSPMSRKGSKVGSSPPLNPGARSGRGRADCDQMPPTERAATHNEEPEQEQQVQQHQEPEPPLVQQHQEPPQQQNPIGTAPVAADSVGRFFNRFFSLKAKKDPFTPQFRNFPRD